MCRDVIGRFLMVIDSRRMLQRKILIQGASEDSIDELDTAADPEDRHIIFQSHLKDDPFHFISFPAALHEPLQRLLMIEFGGNVMAACQEYPVTQLKELPGVISPLRSNDPNAPRAHPSTISCSSIYRSIFSSSSSSTFCFSSESACSFT